MLHKSRPTLANLFASLSLLTFVRPGASDSWSAEFVFPATTGYVMHNLDIMEVSYKSNYPNASLWAFCYNGKVDSANLVIMGVYKNAHPFDGAQSFQFNNDFSSDVCWYNLRNLDNEEKGLNGIKFSYDWKTRDKPSTLKLGSRPEITDAPSSTATDTPASSSASATSAPTGAASGSSTGGATTVAPGSSSATQTSGGSASAAPSQGSGGTTRPPTEASGAAPPPLLNSTAPLIDNGTVGAGGGGNGGHAGSPPLAGGVLAGIVVGAVLGVLGILGFLGALWLMKRHKRSTLSRQSRLRERESKCLDGTYGRAEVHGKSLPGELCGDNKPGLVELPG